MSGIFFIANKQALLQVFNKLEIVLSRGRKKWILANFGG